jgi:hypothetical protein
LKTVREEERVRGLAFESLAFAGGKPLSGLDRLVFAVIPWAKSGDK